jgi:hypothetical protein
VREGDRTENIAEGQFFRAPDGKVYRHTPGAGYGGRGAAPAAARAAASNVAPKAQFQYVPGKGMVPVT